MGDKNPCYRYGHSQAIVLTVGTHISQTEIALLYSTLQSNSVYSIYVQYYIAYYVTNACHNRSGIRFVTLNIPTDSCYSRFVSEPGAK